MESQLRGQRGEKTLTLNELGKVVDNEVTKAPQAGNTVFLTIDSRIQLAAQDALANIIDELRADGGRPERAATLSPGPPSWWT